MSEQKAGVFARLRDKLSRTRENISTRIEDLVSYYKQIDEEFFDELQMILIGADVGVAASEKLVAAIRERVRREKIGSTERIHGLLRELAIQELEKLPSEMELRPPAVLLIVGVNGVGKTTAIGKLANRLRGEGRSVLLAAGDTFRAAAVEQLKIWGERAKVPVISHAEGADPAAVLFDAVASAKARHTDVLICDTAGRLHNKKNLMAELGKMGRVLEKEYPNAQREVLLVLDATTGQNAVEQARTFAGIVPVSGMILTKMDGTAKGGVVLAIASELGIPVKWIGVGETIDDLQPFDARAFVEAII